MTHYRLTDSTPSAIILARNPRTSSLDELKSYTGNHIFLNNGDEFQIRLFNPLTEKIGVQIGFNGQLSKSMLVLNPGEDTIIDRFIDDKKKMVFETYRYDKGNSAAVNAVAKNGIVEIKFFKEYNYTSPLNIYTTGTLTINGGFSTTTTNLTYGSLTNSSGMGTINSSGLQGFSTSNSNSRIYDTNLFSCSVQDSCLDFVSDQVEEEKVEKPVKSKSKKLAETGRIEKGKKSDQDFKQVEIQFQNFPFHVVTYNLKPTSEKSTYHREVREYCTQCGYRVRNNSWIYCPKCGEKI